MKALACSDLGDSVCQFEARAETTEEVVHAMTEHAKKYHQDKIDGMRGTGMTMEAINAMMEEQTRTLS